MPFFFRKMKKEKNLKKLAEILKKVVDTKK